MEPGGPEIPRHLRKSPQHGATTTARQHYRRAIVQFDSVGSEKSEAVLAAALAAIPSAVAILDADRRVIWANRSMFRLVSASPDDLSGVDRALRSTAADGTELADALAVIADGVASRLDRVAIDTDDGVIEREAWVGPVPCPDRPPCAVLVIPAEEERLHPLLANTYDVIAVLSADGTIRYANPAAGRLMAYEGEVMAGTSAIDLVHPDDQPLVIDGLSDPSVISDRPMRLRLRFGDGQWHHCLVHLANLLDDPAVGGIVVTVHDITDQVVAHDEVLRSEQWMRRILTQLTDVVVVFDTTGEITYISPSITALNGTPEDSHVGTSAFGDIHPDDLGAVTNAVSELLDNPDGEVRVTFRLRHTDGHYVWVEAVASNGLVDPAVRGIIATVRDISTLKQAEQMFRGLVDAAPDAMVVVDESGQLVLVNERAAQMFGWSADELIGRPVEVLIPDELRDLHRGHRDGFRNNPVRRTMGEGRELVARHRDGHHIPVEVSLSPHDTHLGPVVSAAIRDITTQRETRRALEAALAGEQEVVRRLEAADALKAEFVSTVAHELRNPLTTISGFARLIEQTAETGDLSSAQIPKLAARVTANADRLLTMIEQLLRFSRLEAGRAEISPMRSPLIDCVRQSVELLGETLADHEMRIEIDEDLEIWADADGIENVVRNLLTNAAKFGPPGSAITVAATSTDEGVEVSVTDQGPGVAPTQRAQVFDQFHQTDSGREKGGTGLGLSIARRYVELHGGRIWLDADHQDGARFCFFLPTGPA